MNVNVLIMSSEEIANLKNSLHSNVRRTIDTLVEKGKISHPHIEYGETAVMKVRGFFCSEENLWRIGFNQILKC